MRTIRLHQALLLLVSLWIGCVSVLAAEEPTKEFNNATVISLVKAKLPPDTIVLAIEGNPGNYDISAEALVELQKEGVPPKVQEAMLRKASRTASSQRSGNQIQPPTAPSPFAPTNMATMMGTVWLIDGTNRIQMKQTALTPMEKQRFHPLKALIGTSAIDSVEFYDGAYAALRMKNAAPVFEFGIPGNLQASQVVTLFTLKVAKDHRELRVSKDATLRTGLLKESVVPITLKEARRENAFGMQTVIYQATPKSPLKPGEYALSALAGKYDFGVE
jgi:hypothetical protein